jgi:hypothetical protein
MARFGVVSAERIFEHPSTSLRACDYVYTPKEETARVLREWMAANPGFMHHSTPAMKDLKARLEAELHRAFEEGRKSK